MLTESGARGLEIVAANAPARAHGVHPGMTLTDGRARVPGLAAEPVDREADRAALRTLGHWMTRWTPIVALDGEDGLMLDVTGCAHLFGGESAMMAAISARLDRGGIVHRLGLAATPGAAWALAHGASGQLARLEGDGERVLAAGLADLPVTALRLGSDALTLLRRFGLTRIGQLSGIDRRALARRFPADARAAADAVVLRLDQALGRRAEPVEPLSEPPEHVERQPCPEPLTDLEGLRAGLDRLLPRLCERLSAEGMGARRLTFTAFRADGTLAGIAVSAARPSRDAAHLGRLFAEKLEELDPGFGVDHLALAAGRVEPMEAAPRPLSRDLAATPVDGEQLAALADRLANRLGAEAVTVAVPHARHAPERAETAEPFDGALPDWSQAGSPLAARPLRVIAPEPVEVLAGLPDGPPARFVWRRVARRVARAEGPERIGPEWWDPAGGTMRARDFYRVEDVDGRRYWLCREGLYDDGRGGAPRWFVHGLFA